MPDRKLTNNEIIKALRSWLEVIRKSRQEYLEKVNEEHYPSMRYEYLLSDTIHEINRLQAENSNLQEKNSNLTSVLTSLQNDLISAKAENKRLRADIGMLKSKMNILNALIEMKNDTISNQIKVIDALESQLKTAKDEAYKECIEKVKALFPSYNEPYQYWEIHGGADNLLKETVGDLDA